MINERTKLSNSKIVGSYMNVEYKIISISTIVLIILFLTSLPSPVKHPAETAPFYSIILIP